MFLRWHQAIKAGQLEPPMDVTHVDAHADLGLGDAGYMYLLSELLFYEVTDRAEVAIRSGEVTDGNWLSYAVACHWVSRVTHVFNTSEDRPNDLMPFVMEHFDPAASNIQLAAVDLEKLKESLFTPEMKSDVERLDHKVPFEHHSWESFQAVEPFDVICLARSPGFTPKAADPLFEEIRSRYVDESAFDLANRVS